jgi:DNA-binding NtrC family response regulator
LLGHFEVFLRPLSFRNFRLKPHVQGAQLIRFLLQNRRGAEEVSSLLNQATGEDKEDTQNDRPLKEHVEAFEKMLIENALRRHRGSIASVMDELSLPRRTLNEKMAKYALSRGEFT